MNNYVAAGILASALVCELVCVLVCASPAAALDSTADYSAMDATTSTATNSSITTVNIPAEAHTTAGATSAKKKTVINVPAKYQGTVSPIPFPTSNKLSRAVQRYTGINRISEIIAGQIAALCLKTKLGGRIKVAVRVYSLTDLLSGKLKSVSVKMSGASYRGVPLGDVTFASTGPFWYHPFKSKHQQVGLQSPLLVKLDGDMNEHCVSRILRNTIIASTFTKFNLPGMGTQQLAFLEPSANIKDGKVCIKSTVITAGGKPDTGVDLIIAGVPYLDGSKVMLKDLKISSPDIVDPGTFSEFAQSICNPLINLARLDRSDHALRLDSLLVQDDSIKYGGNLLLAPTAIASK